MSWASVFEAYDVFWAVAMRDDGPGPEGSGPGASWVPGRRSPASRVFPGTRLRARVDLVTGRLACRTGSPPEGRRRRPGRSG